MMTAPRSNSTRATRRFAALIGIVACIAVAGQLVPTALAGAACPPPPTPTAAFASFGDTGSYVLANDGSFEPLAKGSLDSPWTLTGGASLVADNEPWHISGQGGTALSLPAGSSATSGCTTAPFINTTVRFFVKDTGSTTGQLQVQILVNGGKNGTLNGGTITAGHNWQPAPAINVPWPHPLNGAVQLQVVLTPIGPGASFEVDDVYLDPFCSH